MIDWGKLVAQGRAKAIGVSWNEEELKAIYALKIPAEYVREGILTTEDYQNALAGEKPAVLQPREKLVEQAKEVGIEATPDAPKEVLADLIGKKKVLAKKEVKVAPKAQKAVKKTKK